VTTSDEGHDPRLEVTPSEVVRHADSIEITLRLHNPDKTRAMHYISNVRGITIDSDGRFVVRLTDEGLEAIPVAVQSDAEFGWVNPGATETLTVRVPNAITRMRVGDSPTREVELERFEAPPGQEIEIVIGWSDTAFYPDPRQTDLTTYPTVAWEIGQARSRVTV
jgi:hypothetical protein